MKKDINRKILLVIQRMRDLNPELLKYLDESCPELPYKSNEINRFHLTSYYKSLCQLQNRYKKNHSM